MSDFTHDSGQGPPGSSGQQTNLARLRLVALLGFGAPPLLLVMVAYFILDPVFAPVDPLAAALPAVGLASAAAAAVMPPVAPLPADLGAAQAAKTSVQRFYAATFLKLALCELPAPLGFVAAVAFESGILPLILGALVALAALALIAWPGGGAIERFTAKLEADGARSHLREGLQEPAPERGSP